MQTFNPKEIPTGQFHSFMLGAIAPRPIAFASTIDNEGNVNLSPFSFFNCFGSNPPILIFSPARRVRDNTGKHTLDNVLDTGEVVINIANYAIVEQMSLASTEYDKGVNEFVKAGLTPVASTLVKPPRVAEAPVAFECKVVEVKSMGEKGGAANLVICEAILLHVKDEVFDTSGKTIDPVKLDAVARLGGDWYLRTTPDCLFELPKSLQNKGIGIDQLPEHIRNSSVLTGNNLARLGNTAILPTEAEVHEFMQDPMYRYLIQAHQHNPAEAERQIHLLAKKLLEEGHVHDAWKALLTLTLEKKAN
ncbi:flavin reductase family protein [Rufibacter tibetensis]|uniref:Flavin reductase n=1 Tax=Rufibacter tibetensis TaxID=512763 RepID=A0A0P0CV09_9BACT|nr:flavin reductase family protein [Rufibacter tibetensis]ALI98226.1 flavin reductase [Rufibacter tibetensis]